MKIVSSRALIIRQTDRQTLVFIGLLSEPKMEKVQIDTFTESGAGFKVMQMCRLSHPEADKECMATITKTNFFMDMFHLCDFSNLGCLPL